MLRKTFLVLAISTFISTAQAHFCLLYPASREKAIWPNSNERFFPIPMRGEGRPCEGLRAGPKTRVAPGKLIATFDIGNGAAHVVSISWLFFYAVSLFVWCLFPVILFRVSFFGLARKLSVFLLFLMSFDFLRVSVFRFFISSTQIKVFNFSLQRVLAQPASWIPTDKK